ncbi:MAG: UvrD-helicase domain-containing protein [Bacteroidota bacterium]
MKEFIADLHIHSHHSMATSKQLRPEYLDYRARIKGIKVVGTGDFTHPSWLKELKEKLEPAEPGLFKLREEYKMENIVPETPENSVRFMLSAEISNIYKKNGQVRKIHSMLLAPDFDTAERIQQKLSSMNFNITSDGRPILGLDVRDLLEITLNINENNFFIPAHIWTPWFSMFGSKSGFDTMEECFEDLSQHIHVVETGLSTDPPMNWMCSFLDHYTLVSNSDAHSPDKLGRNANLFKTEPAYEAMTDALKTGDPEKFGGTFDMFPQEGKYHYDGHRKCGVRWSPVDTLKHGGICPVCGKKVTVGVTNRVVRLSDREDILQRKNRLPYYSIIPLKEILSEIEGVGEKSKKISRKYEQLIRKAGTEFNILQYLPVEEVKTIGGEVLAEGIRRMRNNEVIIKEGFDGEYGQITVFQPDEIRFRGSQESLFDNSSTFKNPGKRKLINFDLAEYRRLEKMEHLPDQAAEEKQAYHTQKEGPLKGLNPEQTEAATHEEGPAAVLAGPGTGKTRVLTRRMAWLIQEKNIDPSHILAITFTNKAAGEMQERCKKLLMDNPSDSKLNIATFHAFGYNFLKKHHVYLKQDENFTVIDETDKNELIRNHFKISDQEARKYSARFSEIKQSPPEQNTNQGADILQASLDYQNLLGEYNLFDFDDLIYQVVHLTKNHPEIREELRRQYQWILVDEFQDINRMQYRLMQVLAGDKNPNLFVIGDPNQAIYGFRGSSKRFISCFIEDHKEANIYKLHTSYRCSKNILKASGNVLQEEGLQGLSDGVKVRLAPQQTDKSEAEYIARTIEALSGGLRFFSIDSDVTQGEGDEEIESLSDFAILCRTKQQMRTIEKALQDHTIPYQAVTGDEFFNHPLVKDVACILEYAENPGNRYLERKIAKTKLSGQKPNGHLEKLQQLGSIKNKIQYVHNSILAQNYDNKAGEILQRMIALGEQYGNNLGDFVKYLSLGSSNDAFAHQTEKIALMTLHASKGLEFKCVFIAGCEDGLIPYSMFKNQETDREEEKRLLYVGMTRAQSYLYITHARKRFIMGQERTMQRSPFLNRIEKELTEVEKNTYQKKKQDDSQLKLF